MWRPDPIYPLTPAVSYAAKRFEERFKEDKRVLEMLNKITQSLN